MLLPPVRSLFNKFKSGLTRTAQSIAARARSLVGGPAIDASSLAALEEALIAADFGVATTAEILDAIARAPDRDRALRGQDGAAIGAAVLRRVLDGSEGRLGTTRAPGTPEVICLIGVNGSGKTTTAAKLGWRLAQDGQTVTVAACDTFRAAAVEQLRTWTQRLGLELVASHAGADAAAVAFDAWQAAKTRGRDWLIVDTAGRLHTKGNLMEELAKIRRVLRKHDPTAPQHAWLVVDGSLGANSIDQARVFHREFGLTGVVVTKLDGTSRGGALVGIWRELRLPVYFVGLGEQAEDLQPFSVEHYVGALFGGPDGG